MKVRTANKQGSEARTADNGGARDGPRRWLRSVGPGLVTACVVIGPGSILTSSKVGAGDGYANSWVVVVSVVLMLVYITLGAKLGVVAQESLGELTSRRAGRWLAVLVGLGVFFISAAFQFGNNLGVHSALAAYFDWPYWIVVFNAVAVKNDKNDQIRSKNGQKRSKNV